MRELKFRWYDQTNKEYIYFRPFDEDMVETLKQANEWTKRLNGAKFLWEQFTGLQDKDGRDIYEGDILSFAYKQEDGSYKDEVETVYFSDGQYLLNPVLPLRLWNSRSTITGNINETQ